MTEVCLERDGKELKESVSLMFLGRAYSTRKG